MTRSQVLFNASVFAAALLTGGCASAPAATHHWVAKEAVSGSAYQRDLLSCAGPGGAQPSEAAAFQDYVSCMEAKGYTLTAAAELRR